MSNAVTTKPQQQQDQGWDRFMSALVTEERRGDQQSYRRDR